MGDGDGRQKDQHTFRRFERLFGFLWAFFFWKNTIFKLHTRKLDTTHYARAGKEIRAKHAYLVPGMGLGGTYLIARYGY
jgi:hypothetical protein